MSLSFYYIATVSAMCAIFYGFELSDREPALLKSAVKTASTTILMFGSIFLDVPILLTTALMVGAAGDFFISLKQERGFLQSLVAFAIVQILITILFLQYSAGFAILITDFYRLAGVILLCIAGVWVTLKMWPHLEGFRWPVLSYTCTVVFMGAVALTLPATWPMYLAIMGAGLFVLSDALIGIGDFVLTSNHKLARRIGLTTWFSYYGAFALLLAAFSLQN